jgi:hypothetical protein
MENGGDNLDYAQFADRITNSGDYDLGELTNLLRKDQRPDVKDMIRRVIDGFRFLGQMTELERTLAQDKKRRRRAEIETLKAEAAKRAGEAPRT